MITQKSQGIVERAVEDDGQFFFSISGHDGYFSTQDPGLQQRLMESQSKKKEISFAYDRNLTILEIG